eukprot:1907754-Pyramimonas_sp.AAC.1
MGVHVAVGRGLGRQGGNETKTRAAIIFRPPSRPSPEENQSLKHASRFCFASNLENALLVLAKLDLDPGVA